MKTITTILGCIASLASAQAAPQKTQVFLLAGQSNMDGRADAAGLSEDDLSRLKAVQDRIEFAYNWKPITPLNVTDPAGHVKKKFKLEKSFGPELFFGIALAEAQPDKHFLFIKRAQGGTSLYGCWNPEWSEEKAALMDETKQPKLFQDFLKYSDEVLSARKPGSYEVKAMLWVQGESDSGVKKRGPLPSQTYGANLTKLIKSTRSHFNQNKLPFLMLQVGSGDVVKGMKSIAAADPNVSFIAQSKDTNSPYYLPKNPPPIGHYTTVGMKRIGLNFCKDYLAESVSSTATK